MSQEKRKKTYEKIEALVILALCALTLMFEFFEITYTEDVLHNAYLSKIVQLSIGVITVCLLLRRINVKLFCIPKKLILA